MLRGVQAGWDAVRAKRMAGLPLAVRATPLAAFRVRFRELHARLNRSRWPLRPLLISLLATWLIWGVFLGSRVTLSPETQTRTINPDCRVATALLACRGGIGTSKSYDPAAPAWQNVPADYFFRHARLHGEPRPHWNPYTGSGYPISLDGHNSAYSPTQWLQTHIPGDQGRDVVAFLRFLFWTFGITWLVSLLGASTPLLAAVALAATLAPYGAYYADIVFLDTDLLSPWFVVIVVAFATHRLSLQKALLWSVALGVLIGVMPFQQAHVTLCVVMGLVAIGAAPWTRGRSLLLIACLGAGVALTAPVWLPLLRNLDQFITSRTVQCIAEAGADGGWERFRKAILHPPLHEDRFAFASAVGAALLLLIPGRLRFVIPILLGVGAWQIFGLPKSACTLPVVSGVRFVRHLTPHLQMMFIAGVGFTIAALSRRLDRKFAWIVLVAAQAGAIVIVKNAADGKSGEWLVRSCVLAVFLSLMAAILYAPGLTVVPRRALSRGLYDVALVLFALTPLLFASDMPIRLLEGGLGGPQVPPMPDVIDARTPLGMVQKLSIEQDRRHYSPGAYLHPNWGEALNILELLSLYALYPVGYHELNGGLYKHWERDSQHGLIPDRFVPVRGEAAMSVSFQRVLAVNRVSLLTFSRGNATFSPTPGPYAAENCRLLARSKLQGTESYLCPDVAGVGYFPKDVQRVRTRKQAIDRLAHMSPTEILGAVFLGPEVDLSIAGTRVPELVPAQGRVASFRRMGDELDYNLEVQQTGVFVIADTYFRGWTASVNGEPAGISRANVAFKAVHVPQGHVELKLHFSPAYF